MDSLFRRPHRSPAPHPKPGPSRWTVPDLIDFDYYVDADEQALRASPAARKRLAERDRRLYLEHIKETVDVGPEHSPKHRSAALRCWLRERRKTEDPELRELLPGISFHRGQRLVTIGLGLLGAIVGATVASALLRYDGSHPVNVSWYLFILVLLQILLAAATFTAWSMRRSRPVQTAMRDFSLLSHLVRPLFARVAGWIQRQRLAHAPPEIRDQASARVGLVQAHYALYGPASYLPMLIPAQVFGIGFNVGVILATIFLEWFTDLAFGWGSALDIHPQTIYDLGRFLALPWSWAFGEGAGFPTLDQVAGSRIYLKDPLTVLDAEHLRSWRWFLVLAVVTYGLLPRLLLLGLSAFTQWRTLAALPFTHQRTQALYARMVTPSLETASTGSGTGAAMPIPGPLKPLRAPTAAPRPPAGPEGDEPRTTSAPAGSADAAAGPEPASALAPPRAREPSSAPPTRDVQAPASTAPASTKAVKPDGATPPEPGPATPPPTREEQAAPAPEATAAQGQPRAPTQPESVATAPAHAGEAPVPATAIAADACVLLIHIDIADVLDESDHGRLQQLLLVHTGWRVAHAATFGGGSAMARQAIGLIEQGDWAAPPPRVVLVQDGSQPPITENLRFLRALRAAAGEQAPILLALVGDPDGEDPLPPLSDFELADWKRKIEQMGDPYLRLEMLTTPDLSADPEAS